jgi:hypothetical protein
MLPESLSDSDRRRARRALSYAIEQIDGQPISQKKDADLRWLIKRLRDEHAREMLAAMPKGLYCQLTGRRHNQIDDLAAKHRIPIDGATIDMYAAMRRVHDLLAEMRPRGAIDEEPDGDFADLEKKKLQQEIVKLVRQNERLLHQIDEDRGSVVAREDIRDRLSWLSMRLRALGQQLRKSRGGEDAQQVLNDALKQIADEIETGQLRM